MSRLANNMLAELQSLGLADGVITTVKGKTVTVQAGSLSAQSSKVDEENSDAALEEAVASLLEKVKAKPAKDRPMAWESTTRTTLVWNVDDERVERKLTKDDF